VAGFGLGFALFAESPVCFCADFAARCFSCNSRRSAFVMDFWLGCEADSGTALLVVGAAIALVK
jgi:hypothetical protein